MIPISTNPNQPGTWRFQLFGIPVAVHWMFAVIATLISPVLHLTDRPLGFQLMLVWIVVVFVSILVHEFGHAFAFRRYGGRPVVLLHGLGGLASATGRYTRNQNIVITLAGPGIQLVLALVVYVVWKLLPPVGSPHLFFFLASMLQVNIFWAVLNLLPILPLDGGRLLGHLMHGSRAKLRAQIGTFAALAAGVALFYMTGSLFNLLLFGYLAWMNHSSVDRGYR